MKAWTSIPTPIEYVRDRSPLELQGAIQLQYAQCRNCHSIGGEGGKRGPALDDVATRLNWDQLVRQIQQGGGNMAAFLSTLDGGHLPARIPGAMEHQPGRDQSPTADPRAETDAETDANSDTVAAR
jgi:ubiquinol-cytochrome c reductase cytochrome b subunit